MSTCAECGQSPPADGLCSCGLAVGDDPLLGWGFGGYRAQALLGAGGLARVYRAQATDGRWAALKIVPLGGDPRRRRRFEREARALGALRGPHTARLLGFGVTPGPDDLAVGWLAQTLVDGVALRRRLDGDAPPVDRLPGIAAGLLGALEEAHGAGIVHRDLKPANVMLSADGAVVVLDFGVAGLLGGGDSALSRLTTTGAVLGTPAYMAPEQIDHRAPIGPAADLYAAGVILFEMCAGRRPFDGFDPLTIMRAQLDQPPPALPRGHPLRRAWGPVIARALAKDPAARFPSARAMARALITPPRRRWPWRRR